MKKTSYLTDNAIIVSQGTGMGGGDTGSVAKFPYIWMRALSNGGEGEVIVVEFRWGPEFAGRTEGRREKVKRLRHSAVVAAMPWLHRQIPYYTINRVRRTRT